MYLARLGFNSAKLTNVSNSLKRKYITTAVLKYSDKKTESNNKEVDDLEKPYPYTSSEAAAWAARRSRIPKEDGLWYQDYVISFSVLTFLIYFCILREESDLDRIFDKELKDYFPEMSQEEFEKTMNLRTMQNLPLKNEE